LLLRTTRLMLWGAFILSLGAATAWRQDVNIGAFDNCLARFHVWLTAPAEHSARISDHADADQRRTARRVTPARSSVASTLLARSVSAAAVCRTSGRL
jgi:hypothetical protein